MSTILTRRAALLGLGAAALAPNPARADLSQALAPLKPGGRVLVLRHAQTTPGVGDPPGYTLEDGSTQRNLNALGMDQSRRLGEALAAAGIRIDQALSSRWKRCVDTARIALDAAGQTSTEIEIFEALNNLWDDRSGEAAAVRAIRARIAAWRGSGTLLMVSHGVTIRPALGRGVGQGGFLIAAPDAGDDVQIIGAGAL